MSPWVNCFQWRLVTFHRNNKQIPWGQRETPFVFVFYFFFFFFASFFFSSSFFFLSSSSSSSSSSPPPPSSLLLLVLLLLVLVLQFIRNLALFYYCPPFVPILRLSPPISNIRYLHTFSHLIQPPISLPALLVLSSTYCTKPKFLTNFVFKVYNKFLLRFSLSVVAD